MDRSQKNNDESHSSQHPLKNTSSPQTDPESETSTSEKIKIGLITFKPGISQKNVKTILKNKNQTAFRKKAWSFQSSQLSQEREKLFYSHIDQLAISQLEYTQTKVHNILKLVQHIDFKNLIKLSLPNNSITNIEPLALIKAQNLQFVDLAANYICQSKSLTKLNLLQLEYLEICNNPLFDLNIGRFKHQNPKTYLRLISYPTQVVQQHICFLSKLQHNTVSNIMEFDLKYYSGQSPFGYKFDGYKSQNKLILQPKVCRALNKKLGFQ